MSAPAIFAIAAGPILILLALVELVAQITKNSFIGSVILGQDGRTSTSKTFILVWTLLVGWALVSLLIAGEFVHTHACTPTADIAHAATQCKSKGDTVGLLQVGWMHFLHAGLSGSYLLLLGLPAAAGVAAKGITQGLVNTGKVVKPTLQPGSGRGVFARIAQVFSADDGSTDIADFQYVIFNLITAVYFVTQFVNPDGSGLPPIPDTLLGLTSVSAALYVGNKAVTRSQPTVTAVFPMPLRDGDVFTIVGTGLTFDPAAPTDAKEQVSIGGTPATDVTEVGTNLTAKVPPNLSPGGTPITLQLQVLNAYGGLTPEFPVQCT